MIKSRRAESKASGLLLIVLILVALAIIATRLMGLMPGSKEPQRDMAPPQQQGSVVEGQPKVLIYHTYATQNYQGKDPNATDGPGDIVALGEALGRELTQLGFRVVHLKDTYDLPRWSEAYAKADEALRQAYRTHADALFVIDLRRDALPENYHPDYTTAMIQGQRAAKMMVVIQESPEGKTVTNAILAESLINHWNLNYPGLSRGQRLQTGPFSQELHPRSIQVFVGDYHRNSMAEAQRSVGLLARSLAELAKDLNP